MTFNEESNIPHYKIDYKCFSLYPFSGKNFTDSYYILALRLNCQLTSTIANSIHSKA